MINMENSPAHTGSFDEVKIRDDLLIFSCVLRSKSKGFHKITLSYNLYK